MLKLYDYIVVITFVVSTGVITADDFACNRSHEFKCGDRCINRDRVCNYIVDCDDRSDELNCTYRECNASEYQCRNRQCIPLPSRCDGLYDCRDSSDELACPCDASLQYTCQSTGQCIALKYKCDGIGQCLNNDDEADCSCDPVHQFQCGSYNPRCIGKHQICDLTYDCLDRSDEIDCLTCNKSDQWRCASGQCIGRAQKCDHNNNCADGSDELNCVYPACNPSYQYTCKSGQCVQSGARCNGYADCFDKSDELFCQCNNTNSQFQCTNGQCIERAKRCDRISYCDDNSDEINCTSECSSPMHTCANGFCLNSVKQCSTGQCWIFRCDGFPDCPDASDEWNCPSPRRTTMSPTSRTTTLIRPTIAPTRSPGSNCNGDYRERKCNNGNCFYYLHFCDGEDDCGDNSDELNCGPELTTLTQDNFLVYTSTDRPGIYQYSLDTGNTKQIVSKKPLQPRALALDAANKYIYYTEMSTRTIRRVSLTTRQDFLVHTHHGSLTEFDGLTVDSTCSSSKLYYTAQYYTIGYIYEVTLCNGNSRQLWNKNGSNPRAIIIEPGTSNLYWTDISFEKPGIVLTNVENSSAVKYLVQNDIALPQSLAIDFEEGIMYWLDSYFARIESARLDGSERKRFSRGTESGYANLLTITPYEIYVSDYNLGYFKKMNRYSRSSTFLYDAPAFASLTGLAYYSTNNNSNDNYCRGPGQYLCADSYCIGPTVGKCLNRWCHSYNLRCDGIRDCPDGSDEQECTGIITPACAPGQFQCNDGRCLDMNKMCQGSIACPDKSDIAYCLTQGCPQGKFQCKDTAQCIPSWNRCDGTKQCGDASDELNCTCTANQRKCFNESQCVMESQWCNYISDCRDGSDEANCGTCESRGGFRCNSGQCVPMYSVCDPYSYIHCADHSDEVNCTCLAYQFRCDSGQCVPFQAWCQPDNYYKCYDNSHLKNCYQPDYGCPRDQFSCDMPILSTTPVYAWYNSTQCVPASKRCDWVVDCYNMRDEIGCPCDPYTQFQCDNGRCINGTVWCDGKIDCSDSSDEPADCKECNPYLYMTCNNGRCVNKTARCDGVNNCGDYTDELNCNSMNCSYGFLCAMGLCLEREAYCNGTVECPDGSDDIPGCENLPEPGSFTCNNSRSISNYYRCDGLNHCGDYSDEINCPCGSVNSTFRCDMGYCLRVEYYCDGYRDCPDGSDEKTDCKSKCPTGFFRCNSTGQCISGDLVCDRTRDCPDGSDEQNCNCTADQFRCSGGQCIPKRWLCDGTKDCNDGSDEVPATCNKCTGTQHQCSSDQSCVDQSKICDGFNDCQNESDENNCFTSPLSLAGAVVNGYQTSVVQVKYKGAQFNYICSEGWNTTWNDQICQQMGYGKASAWSSNLGLVGQYKTLKTSRTFSAGANSILSYFNEATCSDHQVLGINCSQLECGKKKIPASSAGSYVINGARAVLGSWPWQASLHQNQLIFCGAVILNDRWILTAAQCLEYVSVRTYFSVGVGFVNRAMNESSARNYYIDKTFVHPSYRKEIPLPNHLYEGDIALLKLSRPITFNDYVQPICLPPPQAQPNQYKVCVAAGFGNTRSDQAYYPGYGSQYLQQGKMTPMTEPVCRAAANDSSLSSLTQDWYKKIFCAGSLPNEYGSNMCPGDEGGPLVCKDSNDNWSVLGVNIINQNCKWSGFTRVTEYLTWIQETMTNNK